MSRPAAPPAGLLLDIDGTLIDSVYLQVASWQQALTRAGLAVAGWRIHDVIGLGMAPATAALGLRFAAGDAHQLQEWHLAALEALSPALSPAPGAAQLLELVAREALPAAMVTNGDAGTAAVAARALPAGAGLPCISAGGDLPPKPAPDSLAAAAERIGAALADCWVVGDTPTDMAAATAAGATGVAVRTGGWAPHDLRAAGAAYVVDDLSVVAAWLDGPAP